MDYAEAFAALAHIHLEDSWVLDVAPADRGIAFHLEAVLTPAHPNYTPPRAGEQHCYRDAYLEVLSEQAAEIELSGAPPTQDAGGTLDLGNIDSFHREPAGRSWTVEGGWGRARLVDPRVSVTFV